MGAAHDRVPFPVAKAPPLIDDPRAAGDGDAARQTAAFRPSSPLRKPQQGPPEFPLLGLVDPIVDRLRGELTLGVAREVEPRATGDLLGRPALLQTVLDILPHARILQLLAPTCH